MYHNTPVTTPSAAPSTTAKQLSHTIVSVSMANSVEEGVATAPSAGFLCMYVANVCDVIAM